MTGLALLALAASCSHSAEPVQEYDHPAFSRLGARSSAQAVVALPALLKLTIDGLAQHLGPPQAMPAPVQAQLSQMPSIDVGDSLQYFQYRSLEVLVNYDARSRRVNDLLLLGNNEDLLMQRAGLAADAANYLLLPVFHLHRPMQLLGLRVVPTDPAPF